MKLVGVTRLGFKKFLRDEQRRQLEQQERISRNVGEVEFLRLQSRRDTEHQQRMRAIDEQMERDQAEINKMIKDMQQQGRKTASRMAEEIGVDETMALDGSDDLGLGEIEVDEEDA